MQMLHSKAVPLNWVADARSKSAGRLTGLDSAAFGSSACAVGWWFRSLCSSGQRTEPNLATEAQDCRPGQAVAPTVKPMGTRWSRVRARCR